MELEKWMKSDLRDIKSPQDLLEMALCLEQSMALYESGIQEVRTKLEILQRESRYTGVHNPIESIKSRIKTPLSIMEKLQRKGYEVSLQSMHDNLSDIAGIRVICPYIEDIYTVADRLTRQDDLTVLAQKDYIKNPKPSGYRSYHLILEVPVFLSDRKQPVRVEVQLRTIAMDFWASLEHQIHYKLDDSIPEDIAVQLRQCAETIALTDLTMQSIARRIWNLKQEENGAEEPATLPVPPRSHPKQSQPEQLPPPKAPASQS